MEQSSYYLVLNYIKEAGRPVTPAELSTALGKSRVTIQSSLKRLVKNGWAQKEGSSPKVYYRALGLILAPQDRAADGVAEPAPSENLSATGLLEAFVLKCNP